MANKNYTISKITHLPKSEVLIEAEISADILDSFWPKAVNHLGEHVKLDGFRPGKIPEAVLVSKIGDMAIVEEAAELALQEIYPSIIIEEKLNVVGQPKVTITKLAKGNPLAFKINVAVVPEFKLPNYKKIASKINSGEEDLVVSEEEMEKSIKEIQKSQSPKIEGNKEEVLPEVTDEFVKTLGDFQNVEDFKKKLKENLALEKEYRAKEKKRAEILEEIIKETPIEVPEVLIESEINKLQSQFEETLKSMKFNLNDYLKQIKKTEEEIKKEWAPDAEKRAKLQLIINKIALDEKLEADLKDIEHEAEHLMEHYKDVSPERLKIYVEMMLTNEKVLKFLGEQK